MTNCTKEKFAAVLTEDLIAPTEVFKINSCSFKGSFIGIGT